MQGRGKTMIVMTGFADARRRRRLEERMIEYAYWIEMTKAGLTTTRSGILYILSGLYRCEWCGILS